MLCTSAAGYSAESDLGTRRNPDTLTLAREAKAGGSQIAVPSNRASQVLEILHDKFDWLDEFDVKIWSCEKGLRQAR